MTDRRTKVGALALGLSIAWLSADPAFAQRRQRAEPIEETIEMDFTVEQATDDEVPAEPLGETNASPDRSLLDPELFGHAAPAERELARFSPIDARAGLRLFHRGLSYVDYQRGDVTPYDLPLGVGIAVGLDYYPAAHVLNDGWAHLGASFGFAHSLGVSSVGPNDIVYPTTAYAWHLGLCYRVPLDERGSELGFEAGMGEHGFRLDGADVRSPPPQGMPDVDFDVVRLALRARLAIDDVVLGGTLAYLPAFAAGEIASDAYFGGADAHGVEARIELAYELGIGFAIWAEVDARVFVVDLPELDSAPASAALALDRVVGGNAGLRWRMPPERQL